MAEQARLDQLAHFEHLTPQGLGAERVCRARLLALAPPLLPPVWPQRSASAAQPCALPFSAPLICWRSFCHAGSFAFLQLHVLLLRLGPPRLDSHLDPRRALLLGAPTQLRELVLLGHAQECQDVSTLSYPWPRAGVLTCAHVPRPDPLPDDFQRGRKERVSKSIPSALLISTNDRTSSSVWSHTIQQHNTVVNHHSSSADKTDS